MRTRLSTKRVKSLKEGFLEESGSKLACKIGLIADVQVCTSPTITPLQYANKPDEPNFAGTRIRKYRQALTGLEMAVDDWLAEGDVERVIQLGDMIGMELI